MKWRCAVTDAAKAQTTKPKYWIKTTTIFCPVCCREDVYRERTPLPKPDSREERFIEEQHYDWCEN
jgi:hypothetical protein